MEKTAKLKHKPARLCYHAGMNKPHLLFISDLHLCPEQPQVTQAFLEFMQLRAPHADALYILGDFFELWIGDDDLSDFSIGIMNALQKLTDSGTPCYFIHGNRDFLIGEKMAERTGIQLLPDPYVIEYGQQRYLLSHGDSLCTDDLSHQRFRRFYLKPRNQRLFTALPIRFRRWIAHRVRQRSQYRHSNNISYRGDINHKHTVDTVITHQCHTLIHGHTHRPIIDTLSHKQQTISRITLPAWDIKPGYLIIDCDNHAELMPL